MKEELTEEYKKRVIDEVQRRIDAWVPRDFLRIEAFLLRISRYPYRIEKFWGWTSFMYEQDIQYSELFHLVKEGVFEKDVQLLFKDAIDTYLCKAFKD